MYLSAYISISMYWFSALVCLVKFFFSLHWCCQEGCVQYLRMHNTLVRSLWLQLTYQTIWESESDSNYAEMVGTFMLNSDI